MTPSIERPKAVIVDMDGTLADAEWRRPRLPNFDKFFVGCGNDPALAHVVTTVLLLRQQFSILIVTGRPESYREETSRWLATHVGEWHGLFMRPERDYRPDDVLKEEILDHDILPNWTPVLSLDDRNKVVAMWRRRGIPCFQVAEGNF